MARISSGTVVAGLTFAALAAVGALAVQASVSASATGAAKPGRSQSVSSSPAPASSAPTRRTYPLPAGSGTGARVVYSLAQDRVWLVDATGRVSRTYPVSPGSVDPAPGVYAVVSRDPAGTGGDGVPIEHVVRFTRVNGVVIGFSAARDGSSPTANGTLKTGGIREARADGSALWEAAGLGAKVVVVL
jgi:hypothetical protein